MAGQYYRVYLSEELNEAFQELREKRKDRWGKLAPANALFREAMDLLLQDEELIEPPKADR